MQNKSSRVFLLLATVLGVLATVTTFTFLESSTAKERGPKVTILVAAKDLTPNTPIDPDKDLMELQISATLTELKQRSLSPDHKPSYRGQRVNRRVLAGTPVMLADLAAMADLQLGPDSRALSITAKGASAVSGLLVPGDYVKLFVTRPVVRIRQVGGAAAGDPAIPMPEQTGRWETQLVLPDAVKVLAVGSKLARTRQQITVGEQFASANESDSQQTVTLEVSEAQAKTILEQTGAGQLPVTIVLCPPGSGHVAPK